MASIDGKKTGGRQKGVPNKITQENRDRVERVLTLLDKRINDDIKKLSPADAARFYSTLIEYQVPKLARTEHTGRVVTENYNVDLTRDEMKEISKTLENDC